MATAAYRAAAGLAPFGVPLIGLGCSCALATDRPKRGDHKVSAESGDDRTAHPPQLCPLKGTLSDLHTSTAGCCRLETA